MERTQILFSQIQTGKELTLQLRSSLNFISFQDLFPSRSLGPEPNSSSSQGQDALEPSQRGQLKKGEHSKKELSNKGPSARRPPVKAHVARQVLKLQEQDGMQILAPWWNLGSFHR